MSERSLPFRGPSTYTRGEAQLLRHDVVASVLNVIIPLNLFPPAAKVGEGMDPHSTRRVASFVF
jgi:hypothetical protein